MRITSLAVILTLVCFVSASQALPNKVYLQVPFLCQAPFGNWGQPWQDACEEAAIVMALAFVKGDQVNKKSGNQEMLALVDYQQKHYGGHFDLTAKQSLKLIKDYYNYDQGTLIENPTVTTIKEELAKGHVVIAPMAGRLLNNPYYTPPGPAYHYMVFKGYDDRRGQFITNDAGTKRGSNYRYKYSVAYQAIHDWTGNKATINQGKKVAIVVKRK